MHRPNIPRMTRHGWKDVSLLEPTPKVDLAGLYEAALNPASDGDASAFPTSSRDMLASGTETVHLQLELERLPVNTKLLIGTAAVLNAEERENGTRAFQVSDKSVRERHAIITKLQNGNFSIHADEGAGTVTIYPAAGDPYDLTRGSTANARPGSKITLGEDFAFELPDPD